MDIGRLWGVCSGCGVCVGRLWCVCVCGEAGEAVDSVVQHGGVVKRCSTMWYSQMGVVIETRDQV